MARRRLRSTFLLKCVVLAASVGIFLLVLVLWLCNSMTLTAGVILFLIVFWFLGIEGGLLPFLLEYIIARQARRSEHAESLWFLDLDEVDRKQAKAHAKATRNNPTIR